MSLMPQLDPFRALRRRDDTFDDFVREFFGRAAADVLEPPIDVSDTERDVVVKMVIPGVEKDQISITVDDRTLHVRGELRKESEEKKKNYYRQEIRYGSFERAVSLPSEVDTDKGNAVLKNGMLTITMPKAKTAKGHQIKIAA
jgi:HSP20 family protein